MLGGKGQNTISGKAVAFSKHWGLGEVWKIENAVSSDEQIDTVEATSMKSSDDITRKSSGTIKKTTLGLKLAGTLRSTSEAIVLK